MRIHVGFTSIKLSHAMVSRYMNKCLKWHGDILTVKSVGIFHTTELSPGQVWRKFDVHVWNAIVDTGSS